MLITEEKWNEVKERARNEYNIPDLSYDVWIKKLELYNVIEDCIIVKIPEGLEHAKAYIENKYNIGGRNWINRRMSFYEERVNLWKY